MIRKKGLMDELADYIKKNLRKGYTKESLRWALTNQGYSKIEIEKALMRVDKMLAEEAPILKTKPEITYNYEIIGDNELSPGRKHEKPKSNSKPKKKGWKLWK